MLFVTQTELEDPIAAGASARSLFFLFFLIITVYIPDIFSYIIIMNIYFDFNQAKKPILVSKIIELEIEQISNSDNEFVILIHTVDEEKNRIIWSCASYKKDRGYSVYMGKEKVIDDLFPAKQNMTADEFNQMYLRLKKNLMKYKIEDL